MVLHHPLQYHWRTIILGCVILSNRNVTPPIKSHRPNFFRIGDFGLFLNSVKLFFCKKSSLYDRKSAAIRRNNFLRLCQNTFPGFSIILTPAECPDFILELDGMFYPNLVTLPSTPPECPVFILKLDGTFYIPIRPLYLS